MSQKRKRTASLETEPTQVTSSSKKSCPVKCQSSVRSGHLWLDDLPSDVCSRIAAYASKGKQTSAALSLAEASQVQRNHVVSALHDHLELCCDERYLSGDAERRWTEVLRPSIRSITLHRFFSLDVPIPHHYLTLFDSSTLVEAEIWNESDILRAVVNAKALRRIKINFRHRLSSVKIFEALSSLDLLELDMHCAGCGPRSCPFLELQDGHTAGYTLGAICPNLRTLRLHCDHGSHPWHLLPGILKLRQLEVSARFPFSLPESARAVLPFLRAIDSVRIKGADDSFRLATELGRVVTCISTTQTLNAKEIMDIAKFPKLSEVSFQLHEKENGLLEDALMPSLSSLHALRLQWSAPRNWLPQKNEWHVARFSSFSPGLMQRIVQKAPYLSNLDLLYVRIETKELQAILKHIGARLERFWISIVDQEEPPFDRLQVILQSLVCYNPGIRTLVLEKGRTDVSVLTTMLRVKALKDPQSVSEQGRRLYTSLRMLKQSAAMLDTGSVEKWLSWYFWEQRDEFI